MTATTVYPRFLGIDGSGDFVWELETGRWTWGEDPHDAAFRERTFEPVRYIEKYGRPIPFVRLDPETGKAIMAEPIDRKAEGEEDPAELAKLYVATPEPGPARLENAAPAKLTDPDQRAAASLALYSLLVNLDGWIDGAKENHEALDHRNEGRGEECWTRWHPADFRSMVNDVACELGLSEFPKPSTPREDEVR
jgi:hypothetical protein